MAKLRNHVAVVTGASSGIGKAIARGLSAEGAKLCLLGRNLSILKSIAREIGEGSREIDCYEVDLAVDRETRRVATHLREELGALDILVHSAGVATLGEVASASTKDLDRQYRTNVRGPYTLTQKLLPAIRAGKGQIVFINSSAALGGRGGSSQYSAMKHALKGFAESLRAEVNPDGVRVLSVFLGRTATPMQAYIHEREGRPYRPALLIQPEDVAMVVIKALTLPRTAEVTDISMRPLAKPV